MVLVPAAGTLSRHVDIAVLPWAGKDMHAPIGVLSAALMELRRALSAFGVDARRFHGMRSTVALKSHERSSFPASTHIASTSASTSRYSTIIG